jgi:hypothetical protein
MLLIRQSHTMKHNFTTVIAFSLCVPLCGVMPVRAQHLGSGTTLFDFVNISYEAREVALAGASVSLPDDGYGIFTNPAALGFVGTMQAVVGYRPLGVGVFGTPLAYVLPYRGNGVFGIGFCGLTGGITNPTDVGPDGGPLFLSGEARVDYVAGIVSWAKRVNEYLSAGVTAKGMYTYLKGVDEYWSADGVAFDGGLQCRFLNSHLIYGLVVRNIGISWSGFESGDDYSLPLAVQIGVSYVPRHIENLRVVLDINKTRNDYLTFKFGGELEIIKNQMTLRAGYSLNWRDLQSQVKVFRGEADDGYYKSNMTGLCLGAGFITEVIQRKVQLDVAAEFLTSSVLPALVVSALIDI